MDETIPMKDRIPLRWRSRCRRYSVAVRKRCLTEMLRMAREHQAAEIGSALCGCYSSDGRRAVVMGMTPVPPDSHSSTRAFVRGVVGLAEFFRDLFARSRGRRHYVGEWHSHPNAPPQPSAIDWARQRELAEDPAMECAECILIVVGGNLEQDPRLGVYVHSRERGQIALTPA